jgi:hypothetical protein
MINVHDMLSHNLYMYHSRNDQYYALIVALLSSIYWLLHVLPVDSHYQGASYILSYFKYELMVV